MGGARCIEWPASTPLLCTSQPGVLTVMLLLRSYLPALFGLHIAAHVVRDLLEGDASKGRKPAAWQRNCCDRKRKRSSQPRHIPSVQCGSPSVAAAAGTGPRDGSKGWSGEPSPSTNFRQGTAEESRGASSSHDSIRCNMDATALMAKDPTSTPCAQQPRPVAGSCPMDWSASLRSFGQASGAGIGLDGSGI